MHKGQRTRIDKGMCNYGLNPQYLHSSLVEPEDPICLNFCEIFLVTWTYIVSVCDPMEAGVKEETKSSGQLHLKNNFWVDVIFQGYSIGFLCLSGKSYFILCYHFTDNRPVEIVALTVQEIIDRSFGLQVHHTTKMIFLSVLHSLFLGIISNFYTETCNDIIMKSNSSTVLCFIFAMFLISMIISA